MNEKFSLPGEMVGAHRALRLAEVRTENYRTRSFIFEEGLSCQPGQFVMAWLPGVGEKPFSIAAATPLMLMVVAVGPVSEALHQLQAGQRLWVRGPLGQGFRLKGRRALLVGGGYGVAPLLFLARQARQQAMEVDVCIGARTAADVLLTEEFEQLGVRVHVTTEDGSLGQAGLVTAATGKLIETQRPDGLYACGPVRMLEALEKQARQMGVDSQLSWEAHMRCGMGLCGSCELPGSEERSPGWLACLDGPVWRSDGE
jgi:dihydroorotate dehydrogenase electron transfer subunit